MGKFRHKKSLGQHFLKNESIAAEIVDAFAAQLHTDIILEVGPGEGVLTKYLLKIPGKELMVSEIDGRIIDIMRNRYHLQERNIFTGDFLQADLQKIQVPFSVIGNFPYNISSQIVFKILEAKQNIPLIVGMFQKEMAERITALHGNKDYGVISILVQAFYAAEYLFELSPDEFHPPPKVHSAVIQLTAKENTVSIPEKQLRTIVKTAFQQRRKKLSNALSSLPEVNAIVRDFNFAEKRAEEISVADYIRIAEKWTQP